MASDNDNMDNAEALTSELAGEYVLGTLSEAERGAVEARIEREPVLADAVLNWQTRLAPLDDATSMIEPPSGQLDRVFARIDAATSSETPGAEIIQLKRKARVWRMSAMASGAIAAALALFMVFGNIPPTPSTDRPDMVALLESPDKRLVYIASINTKSGRLSLKRLGAGPKSGKSHELWAIVGSSDKPLSLGVIKTSAEIPVSNIYPAAVKYFGDITLAVSLEPKGGSPTGQPTGPVLFTGKCIELPEV